jgi:hypothetical protein
MKNYKEELKILSIGNSFSVDTMEHVANIALSLGVKKVKLGNLYIGGCSINMHFRNAENDAPNYTYYTNSGDGWSEIPSFKISDAVKSENWDIISIQNGSGDGSRYSDPKSYEKLSALIDYVRSLAWQGVKIAFNMTWVAEPTHDHHELVFYGGDQILTYKMIAETTKNTVLPTNGLDILSPVGTAVQNARTAGLPTLLTRDGYHLSYSLGRYTAGLTFLKALTGCDIGNVEWVPEGVSKKEKAIAVSAALAAVDSPFDITKI